MLGRKGRLRFRTSNSSCLNRANRNCFSECVRCWYIWEQEARGWAWSVRPSAQSRLTGQCRGSCSEKNCRHSLVLAPVLVLLPAGLGTYVQDKAILFQAGNCGFSCSVAGTCGWDLPPFPLPCSLSLSIFPTLFCTLFWPLSYEYHSNDRCSLNTSVPQ